MAYLAVTSPCPRSEEDSSTSSIRESKDPGPDSRCLHTIHFICKTVRGWGLSASVRQRTAGLEKALFLLPRLCSVEVCLIGLDLHWTTGYSHESRANCPGRNQDQDWKTRWGNQKKAQTGMRPRHTQTPSLRQGVVSMEVPRRQSPEQTLDTCYLQTAQEVQVTPVPEQDTS